MFEISIILSFAIMGYIIYQYKKQGDKFLNEMDKV
jgi:hypothetical protein